MVSKYCIRIEHQEIWVDVVVSDRKSMALEVQKDGSVLVRVPKRISGFAVKRFVAGHAGWIYEKRQQAIERQSRQKSYVFPIWEEMSASERKKAKEKILTRVQHYADEMQVSYHSVAMRNQKSRWGSCSGKGNLNFNYRLAYLPEELLDYVVIHELAHRRYMDHSANFWRVVENFCPTYREDKEALSRIEIS